MYKKKEKLFQTYEKCLKSQVAVALQHPGRRIPAGEALSGQYLSTEPGDDRGSDTPPRGRPSVQRRASAGRAAGVDQQTNGEHVEQVNDNDVRRVADGEAAATASRVPPVPQTAANPAATGRDRSEALVIERRVAISKLNARVRHGEPGGPARN